MGYKKILASVLAAALLGAFVVHTETKLAAPGKAVAAVADASAWQSNLNVSLNEAMADELLQRTQAGVMVYDLTTGETIFKYNERQLMRPASSLKLLTAVTALERLGPGYKFTTKLAYSGTITNGTLNGNVYCIGGFDPCFGGSDMVAFAEGLRALGVRSISGQLIADTSMISTPRWGQGWCWDDVDDNPVLTPLIYNRQDKFMLGLQQVLQSYNITASPLVGNGEAPADVQLICETSHSMPQLLQKMLKDSDNLYAEAMFYNLAASYGIRYATAAQAKAQVNSFITQIGLQPENYRVADGSGLSVYNYLSPELEVAVLKYAYQHPPLYEQLYPALPVGGVDGTLDIRQKNIAGRVHAKTGSMTGVYALAGYTNASNGHLLAFSIMNEGILSEVAARSFQDKLCTLLCTVQ